MTVFQSLFPSEGKLVFFSDIILFIISIFIIFSCFSLFSVWFGCVVFWLLLLCGSFRIEDFGCSVFIVSIIVLGSSLLGSFFICWCISNILKSGKKSCFYYHLNLLSESLTCFLKYSAFFQVFYNSFSITFLCRFVPKITMKCTFVVFPVPFSELYDCLHRRSWKTANISMAPHVGYQGSTCRSWHTNLLSDPTLSYVSISHFLHGKYIVTIPDPGVFLIVWTPVTCDQVLFY